MHGPAPREFVRSADRNSSAHAQGVVETLSALEHSAISHRGRVAYLLTFLIAVGVSLGLRAPFIETIIILTLLYGILGVAWNIVGGVAGQPLFASSVFFGVGAYGVAIVTTKLGLSAWAGVAVGAAASIALGVLIGVVTLPLRGHYFAVATFVMGAIGVAVFESIPYVNGSAGISLLGRTSGPLTLQWITPLPYICAYLLLAVCAVVLAETIGRSKAGLYLRAVRHSPIGAAHLGVRVTSYKLYALVICATISAVAGSLYALYLQYISPTSIFATNISVEVVLVALLGGIGTTAGPLLGAAILIPLGQELNVLLGQSGGWNLAIYGVIIIAVVRLRPAGILSLVNGTRKSEVPLFGRQESDEPS